MTTERAVRRPSRRLTLDDVMKIWPRIMRREFHSRIAADYDVNQGRIADIKKGRIFPEAWQRVFPGRTPPFNPERQMPLPLEDKNPK